MFIQKTLYNHFVSHCAKKKEGEHCKTLMNSSQFTQVFPSFSTESPMSLETPSVLDKLEQLVTLHWETNEGKR